jgi:hypothetical protein
MKKQLTIGIAVCWLVTFITAYAGATVPQGSKNSLLSQRMELHLRKATLMYALSTLAVDYRVPIGIEYSPADKNEEKLDLDTKNGSLREILDAIVKQEPLYRWELVDGVVNFVPISGEDPFFETLLNTPISHYDPGKWTIKFQLRDAIENTPEVKKLLESKNVELAKYRDYAYKPSIYTPKDPPDLRMSNTTVRQILNRIVKVSEHKRWAIGWRQGEKNVFSIWL